MLIGKHSLVSDLNFINEISAQAHNQYVIKHTQDYVEYASINYLKYNVWEVKKKHLKYS